MEQMYRHVSFELRHPPTEEELSDFEDIAKIFIDYGLNLRLRVFEGRNAFVFIDFDSQKLHRKNRRKAGAPRKYVRDLPKVRDVKQMRETMTAAEVAEKLGVSVPTLYRRLNKDDDSYF